MLKNKFFILFSIVFLIFSVSCSSLRKVEVGEQPAAYTEIWEEVRYITETSNKDETITFDNDMDALIFLLAEQKNQNSELQKEIEYYKEQAQQENVVYVAVKSTKEIDPIELIGNNKLANTVTLSGNHDFSNSITVYTYQTGKIYDIFFSPLNITDLQLQPGEEVVNVVIGDTSNWLCESVASIEDDLPCMHLFIRPYNINISTDCEILTNRRNYYLRLYSTDKAQLAVKWRYPYSSKVNLNSSKISGTSEVLAPELAVAVSSLNFNYRIDGKASWKPVRAFSDSQRTYIQFNNSFLSNSEAPVPYLKTGSSQEELINFTAKGINYIIPIILASNQKIILKTEKQEISISLSN